MPPNKPNDDSSRATHLLVMTADIPPFFSFFFFRFFFQGPVFLCLPWFSGFGHLFGCIQSPQFARGNSSRPPVLFVRLRSFKSWFISFVRSFVCLFVAAAAGDDDADKFSAVTVITAIAVFSCGNNIVAATPPTGLLCFCPNTATSATPMLLSSGWHHAGHRQLQHERDVRESGLWDECRRVHSHCIGLPNERVWVCCDSDGLPMFGIRVHKFRRRFADSGLFRPRSPWREQCRRCVQFWKHVQVFWRLVPELWKQV